MLFDRQVQNPRLKLFVGIFLGLVVAGLPFTIASNLWWSGVNGLAVFAVIIGLAATATHGPQIGAAFTGAFAVVGLVAIIVSTSPLLSAIWVAAVVMGVAVASIYSLSGPALFIAMYTPYLIHQPPVPVDGSDRGFTYYLAVVVVMLIAGAWGCTMAWLLRHNKSMPAPEKPVSQHLALLGGGLVAGVAALVTFVAVTRASSTEWVWILLTLFILTKPTAALNWTQTRARLTGTFIGVLVAVIIGLFGLPSVVLSLFGLLALTTALMFKFERQPYWMYASCLTPAILFFDSAANDTTTLALERMGYTLVGAILAGVLAVAINSFVIRDEDRSQPTGLAS